MSHRKATLTRTERRESESLDDTVRMSKTHLQLEARFFI